MMHMNNIPASVFSTAMNQAKTIPVFYEHQIEMECGDLVFSSKFDSGNLTRVQQVEEKENEFRLWTSPDPNDLKSATNCSWFHFGINGGIIGKTYTFTIMNMKKHQILYQQGLQPFVKINYLQQIESGEENNYERLPCKPIVNESENGMELTFTFKYPDLSNPGVNNNNNNNNNNSSGLRSHHINKGKKNKSTAASSSNQDSTKKKKKSPTSQSIEGNKNQISDLESTLHRMSVSHNIHMKSLNSIDNITNPNFEATKAEFESGLLKKKLKDVQIYFAFCHPYSYTELQRDLHLLENNYGNVAKELHLSYKEKLKNFKADYSVAGSSNLSANELVENSSSMNPRSSSSSSFPDIPHDRIYLHRELLTRSPDGRRIDLITLTDAYGLQSNQLEAPFEGLNPRNQEKKQKQQEEEELRLSAYNRIGQSNHNNNCHNNHEGNDEVDDMAVLSVDENHSHIFVGKETIVISARVHPGEVPASHVLNGIINFLLRRDDPRARLLRRRFVFKIIPMLNPDGVARGHFRLDQHGLNLNRLYTNPDPVKHPSIFAVVKVVERYSPPRPSAKSICQEGITKVDTSTQKINGVSPSGNSTSSSQSEGSSCNGSLKNRSKKKKPSINSSVINEKEREKKCNTNTSIHNEKEESTSAVNFTDGDGAMNVNSDNNKNNNNTSEAATITLRTETTITTNEPVKNSPAPIFMYLDLHAHAMKRGCFLYGNSLDNMDDQISAQLYPLLNTINNQHVDYDSCIFSRKFMNRVDSGERGMSAEGTGRVYFYKKFNILYSYTVECNYNTGRLLNHVPAVLRKVVSSSKKTRGSGNNSTSDRRISSSSSNSNNNNNSKFPDIVKVNDASKKQVSRIIYKGMGQQCKASGIDTSPSQFMETNSASILSPTSSRSLLKSNRDPSPERFPSATCPKYTNLDWGSVGIGLLVSILDLKGCNPWTRVPNSRYRTTERAALTIAAQLRSKEIYNNYKNNATVETTDKSKQHIKSRISGSTKSSYNHWAPSPRNKNAAFTSVINLNPAADTIASSEPLTNLMPKSSIKGTIHGRKSSEKDIKLENVALLPQTISDTSRLKKNSFSGSSTTSSKEEFIESLPLSTSKATASNLGMSQDKKNQVGRGKHRRTPSISIPAGASIFPEDANSFSPDITEKSTSVNSLLK